MPGKVIRVPLHSGEGKTGPIRLPLRHLSIRVPWHDLAWTGSVCKDPRSNVSCLALTRIRESKDDDVEERVAGRDPFGPKAKLSDMPPCVAENGFFMRPTEFVREIRQPYSETSEHHRHILPTRVRYAPYTAATVPYRWMLKENAFGTDERGSIAEQLRLDVRPQREPDEPEWLQATAWVQEFENQKSLLEAFYGPVKPEQSLCFFYAKRTPLADDPRRVLIGAGRILRLGELREYEYARGSSNQFRNCIWDRPVEHSIRPDFADGFVLPYHELAEALAGDSNEKLADFVAFVPDEKRGEFSYGTEHVSAEGGIAALLAAKRALAKMEGLVKAPVSRALDWIDESLNSLWRIRGPYPGFSAALCALGVERPAFLAYEILEKVGVEGDPWEEFDAIANGRGNHSRESATAVTVTIRKLWQDFHQRKPERLALLMLLSRVDLTNAQALRWFHAEARYAVKNRYAAESWSGRTMSIADDDVLNNPFLLSELDRFSPDPVDVRSVDRAILPHPIINARAPIPEPSCVSDHTDIRRVRALVVDVLERRAAAGDTIVPLADVVQSLREAELMQSCPVTGEILEIYESELKAEVVRSKMKDGTATLQLARLEKAGSKIRETIRGRVGHDASRSDVSVDWRAVVRDHFGTDKCDDTEQSAREEKALALEELAASRFSVLVGPAGTGKTTLLELLCSQPEIERGGVLLLAPTGKARVRLSLRGGKGRSGPVWQAKTIAQFLLPRGGFDPETGSYCAVTDKNVREVTRKTVIVDEASMITETQLAALLSGIANYDRLILVGDPSQLPPIGAGRPFVDIVTFLQGDEATEVNNARHRGYAELSIVRRQGAGERADVDFASWFGRRPIDAAADEILERAWIEPDLETIRFVSWSGVADLEDKIMGVLVSELQLSGRDDEAGFLGSLGATRSGRDFVWEVGDGAANAENWQILSPSRNLSNGTAGINRVIQRSFRKRTIDKAMWGKQVPKPAGNDSIVYGDKVINLSNHRRDTVNPRNDALCYVANGEVGVVVGEHGRIDEPNWSRGPRHLIVEFSSQPRHRYTYRRWELDGDRSDTLELGYAVTIHRAQGSEFDMCFVVMPAASSLYSRELLYTALTRQRRRVVVFHEGSIGELLDLGNPGRSETARRLTNLFGPPEPVVVEGRVVDGRFLHVSSNGIAMRSKSEVIIAGLLEEAGLEWQYECRFEGSSGPPREPDFTIRDENRGRTYLWEHCGMMGDPGYLARWNRKLAWYKANGVLPIEEGGGPRASLIVTQDTIDGGIRADEIRQIIRTIWGK